MKTANLLTRITMVLMIVALMSATVFAAAGNPPSTDEGLGFVTQE